MTLVFLKEITTKMLRAMCEFFIIVLLHSDASAAGTCRCSATRPLRSDALRIRTVNLSPTASWTASWRRKRPEKPWLCQLLKVVQLQKLRFRPRLLKSLNFLLLQQQLRFRPRLLKSLKFLPLCLRRSIVISINSPNLHRLRWCLPRLSWCLLLESRAHFHHRHRACSLAG